MKATEKQAELRARIKTFRNKRSSFLPPEKPFNLKGVLHGLVFFLPIIYVTIYIIGFMMHVGIIDKYGLSPVEFPIAVDMALLLGVAALVTGLKYWCLLPILLAAYMVIVIFLLFAHKPRQRAKRWLMNIASKIPKPNKPSHGDLASAKGLMSQAEISATFTVQLSSCFIIVIVLMTIGYGSMRQGSLKAEKQQQQFLSSKTHHIYESSALVNPPYMRVVCNTTHCAFWNQDGTLLLRHDQIQKTLLVPDKKEQ